MVRRTVIAGAASRIISLPSPPASQIRKRFAAALWRQRLLIKPMGESGSAITLRGSGPAVP